MNKEQLNEAILNEQKKYDEMGIKGKSMEEGAKEALMKPNQKIYAKVINKYVTMINKDIKKTKKKGQNNEMLAVYAILMDGYQSQEWSDVENIKRPQVELIIPETEEQIKGNDKWFQSYSRRMLRIVDKLRGAKGNDIGMFMSLDHIVLNWFYTVSELQTLSWIDECIKGFKNLTITDGETKSYSVSKDDGPMIDYSLEQNRKTLDELLGDDNSSEISRPGEQVDGCCNEESGGCCTKNETEREGDCGTKEGCEKA